MKRTVTKTTDRVTYNNLKTYLDEATSQEWADGKEWYKEAQAFVYEQYHNFKGEIDGLTSYRVAGVLSATSPNNRWERNKADTITVLKAVAAGLPPEAVKICTYTPNKVKAFEIAKGNIELSAKSPKTHAFAMNVGLNSPDHITVDKWHLRACVTKSREGVVECAESCTAAQYRRVEAITAQLAHDYGLKGYEAQAIIWVTIKRIWNR
jgi:hypothetical protein